MSEKTVKRWIKRGLPMHQAGPREKVLIRPADLDQYLTRRQVPQVDLNVMVEEVLKDITL